MVDLIKGLSGYQNKNLDKGSSDKKPRLIAAIIDEDEERVENLLSHEESDPREEYIQQNAYEHASSKERKKKIDLQMLIGRLMTIKGIDLSQALLEMHREARTIARNRHAEGKGPGVYQDPQGADFREKVKASHNKGGGPGIVV